MWDTDTGAYLPCSAHFQSDKGERWKLFLGGLYIYSIFPIGLCHSKRTLESEPHLLWLGCVPSWQVA